MIANFVICHVKQGARKRFIDAALGNCRGSINGPGCLATSIFPDPQRADVAYMFEVS